MDDLLALFDAAIPEDNDNNTLNVIAAPPTNMFQPPTKIMPLLTTTSSSNHDPLGIRMIHRKISSTDLMHRMIDYPFHSTAQLCAASLSTLNTLLIEPTTILDVATVNGKTHLWTLGIVFTNTGSRIGPSGKAYCILTIGTLTTGPTITIMLFGTSYLTYCRTVRPGMVIALIHPRLLSPRTTSDRATSSSSSSNTTIRTYSVTGNEQLLVVGDAQDYGRCKATTSSKNEYGQWIPNSKACNNYVDKRQGDFCAHHRKHQHKSTEVSSHNTSSSGKVSSMQQLRTQAAAFPSHNMNGRSMQQSDHVKRTVGHQTNSLLRQSTNINQVRSNLASSKDMTFAMIQKQGLNQTQKQQQQLSLPSQNRYTPHQSKNPLLSEKISSGNSHNSVLAGPAKMHPTSNNKSVNPYASKKQELQPLHLKARPKVEPQKVTRNALQTIDILQLPPKRPMSSGVVVTKMNKKRHVVNTDTPGFNGSVRIPAPAKIFSQRNGGPNQVPLFVQQQPTRSDPLRRTENVIVQQQMIASQLQASQILLPSNDRSNVVHAKSCTSTVQGKAKLTKEIRKDDLFGSHFDAMERENIINAKSQFTSEVEAEEYARSRRVVCELEEQESKKLSTANANHLDGSIPTPVIQKEWYCFVCKKHFSQEPIRCSRLQHRTKMERNIRTTKSKGEERLAMTEAKAEDGGLVLGTGLDWSRFPSNRFS